MTWFLSGRGVEAMFFGNDGMVACSSSILLSHISTTLSTMCMMFCLSLSDLIGFDVQFSVVLGKTILYLGTPFFVVAWRRFVPALWSIAANWVRQIIPLLSVYEVLSLWYVLIERDTPRDFQCVNTWWHVPDHSKVFSATTDCSAWTIFQPELRFSLRLFLSFVTTLLVLFPRIPSMFVLYMVDAQPLFFQNVNITS